MKKKLTLLTIGTVLITMVLNGCGGVSSTSIDSTDNTSSMLADTYDNAENLDTDTNTVNSEIKNSDSDKSAKELYSEENIASGNNAMSDSSEQLEQSNSGGYLENPIQENDIADTIDSYGETSEAKVLKISSDMTYGEAIELLGEPETVGLRNGYAQYTVDKSKLLMMFYSDINDTLGINGDELLAKCIDLSELEANYNEFVFEGFVVSNEGGIRVTCPQYAPLNCADLSFSDGTEVPTVNVGDKVMIYYSEDVLLSYPPIINVEQFYIE